MPYKAAGGMDSVEWELHQLDMKRGLGGYGQVLDSGFGSFGISAGASGSVDIDAILNALRGSGGAAGRGQGKGHEGRYSKTSGKKIRQMAIAGSGCVCGRNSQNQRRQVQ